MRFICFGLGRSNSAANIVWRQLRICLNLSFARAKPIVVDNLA
jgi:hypothetical protein